MSKPARKAGRKESGPVFSRQCKLMLLAAMGLSMGLNLYGITASYPNACNWCNDTIAGMNSLNQRPGLFRTWMNKYPRMQFMVNNAAFTPFLHYWREHPVSEQGPGGRTIQTPVNFERVSKLALLSLVITALMGAGTVAAVFLTGRLLFESDLAAFLAAAAMACIHEFVFYAHSGNTDVPATFWYAWCVYLAVKAIRLGKWRHYVLLAAAAAVGVGTKDPTVGFLVGLGLALAAHHIIAARQEGAKWGKAFAACINKKTMTALAIFIFGFALINNIITDPAGYLKRMSYWRGYDLAIWARPAGITSQLQLVVDGLRDMWSAAGWPLLGLAAAGLVWAICGKRGQTPGKQLNNVSLHSQEKGSAPMLSPRFAALFCVLPIVTFHLIVICQIRFSTPRFWMPGYVGMALLAGAAAAALLRSKPPVRYAAAAIVAFVYVTTFLYGLGSSMDIARDTRVRAGEWFRQNVSDKNTPVATLIAPWYAPYLPKYGFNNYEYPWVPPAIDEKLKPESLPPYIVTGLAHQVIQPGRAFWEALSAGRLPYVKAASFEQEYFWPKKTVFGFAGWPMARARQSSPPITVWERK